MSFEGLAMKRCLMTTFAVLIAAVLAAPAAAVAQTTECNPGLYKISGRILKNGVGAGGIVIDGGTLGQMTSAADGSFTFSNLPCYTPFYIKPVGAACEFSPQYRAGEVFGDYLLANFLVENDTCGMAVHTVSGSITRKGSGIAGVVITRTGSPGQATTDAAGNFTLAGIPDGAFTLTASKAGFEFVPESRSIDVHGSDLIGQDFSALMRGDEKCRTQSYSFKKSSLKSSLSGLKSTGLSAAKGLLKLKTRVAKNAAKKGERKITILYDTAAYYIETVPATALVCPADISVCLFEKTGTDVVALKKAGRSLYSSVRRLVARYYFLARKHPGALGKTARARYVNFKAGADSLSTMTSVCR